MLNVEESYTFDDLLLKPKFSKISSRNIIDTSVKINNFSFTHPMIPANMETIVGPELINTAHNLGGLVLIHRFMSIKEQLSIFYSYKNEYVAGNTKYDPSNNIGVSVGVKKEDIYNIDKIISEGVQIICIDIAHGDSQHCLDMISFIKEKYPFVLLIAGNVATGKGAANLAKAGADVIKVGVGNGATCLTRINTGNGAPQMSALCEVKETLESFNNKFIIADGGIKSPGDCVKALCFADMVMTGSVFAGCKEAPGDVIEMDGRLYKKYEGSSTIKDEYIEGVKALVECKGSFGSIVNMYLQNIRSGCSYQGVNNLKDLKINPQFVKITNAGLVESHPHDVAKIIK